MRHGTPLRPALFRSASMRHGVPFRPAPFPLCVNEAWRSFSPCPSDSPNPRSRLSPYKIGAKYEFLCEQAPNEFTFVSYFAGLVTSCKKLLRFGVGYITMNVIGYAYRKDVARCRSSIIHNTLKWRQREIWM